MLCPHGNNMAECPDCINWWGRYIDASVAHDKEELRKLAEEAKGWSKRSKKWAVVRCLIRETRKMA